MGQNIALQNFAERSDEHQFAQSIGTRTLTSFNTGVGVSGFV